ncbi:MAG: hypothetical protein AAGE05_08830, partial [Pseudomonadota bacterium]
SEANPPGHWESLPLANLNNRVMEALERPWFDPKPLPDGWTDRADVTAILGDAADLLEREYGGADRIVVKDPRLSRLLPLWMPVFDAMGYTTHYGIACRNPLEVAASLRKRDAIQADHAHLLWQSHMIEAELHTRGRSRTFVHYEALLGDWRSILAALHPSAVLEPRDDIDAFLDSRYRTVTYSRADVAQSNEVPDDVKTLDALLGEIGDDWAAHEDSFDRLRQNWLESWEKRSPGTAASAFSESLPLSWIRKSRASAQQGDRSEALKAARRAVAMDPMIARHHHYLGTLLERYDQLEAADGAYREAIRLYAGEPRYLRSRAKLLHRLGRSDEAVEVMRALLALDAAEAEDENLLKDLSGGT